MGKANGAEWFDLGTKSIVKGIQYSFEVKDDMSGVWNLNVRIQDDLKKADATAVTSSKVGSIYDQIKRKSITFNETVDNQNFYNVIGISYIDEGGRLHLERISDINEIPDGIKSKFKIKKYGDISPHKNIILKDKLVTLVDKNNMEDMALLFFLQKIEPIFKVETK